MTREQHILLLKEYVNFLIDSVALSDLVSTSLVMSGLSDPPALVIRASKRELAVKKQPNGWIGIADAGCFYEHPEGEDIKVVAANAVMPFVQDQMRAALAEEFEKKMERQ